MEDECIRVGNECLNNFKNLDRGNSNFIETLNDNKGTPYGDYLLRLKEFLDVRNPPHTRHLAMLGIFLFIFLVLYLSKPKFIQNNQQKLSWWRYLLYSIIFGLLLNLIYAIVYLSIVKS
jgi:hypothetical protein